MSLERLDFNSSEWATHSADHVSRYLFASSYTKGKRVLDAGTGMGYGAAILKVLGATSVTAVDISDESLTRARAGFGELGVNYLRDDCEKLSTCGGPFDVIVSFENIEHLPHPEEFVKAASRLLSADGVLLCSTPDRLAMNPFIDGKPANEFHVNEWYRDEFITLLSKEFSRVDYNAQVLAHHAYVRQQAVLTLMSQINAIPFVLLKKILLRTIGRSWKNVYDLTATGPAEYPVFPGAIAGLMGRPFCHVASCHDPIRSV